MKKDEFIKKIINIIKSISLGLFLLISALYVIGSIPANIQWWRDGYGDNGETFAIIMPIVILYAIVYRYNKKHKNL